MGPDQGQSALRRHLREGRRLLHVLSGLQEHSRWMEAVREIPGRVDGPAEQGKGIRHQGPEDRPLKRGRRGLVLGHRRRRGRIRWEALGSEGRPMDGGS